jgi:hypothetical protein
VVAKNFPRLILVGGSPHPHTVYWERGQYNAIVEYARDEDRSFNKMVSILVAEALKARNESL